MEIKFSGKDQEVIDYLEELANYFRDGNQEKLEEIKSLVNYVEEINKKMINNEYSVEELRNKFLVYSLIMEVFMMYADSVPWIIDFALSLNVAFYKGIW